MTFKPQSVSHFLHRQDSQFWNNDDSEVGTAYSPIAADIFWSWRLRLISSGHCCRNQKEPKVTATLTAAPRAARRVSSDHAVWSSHIWLLVNGQRSHTRLVCQKIYGSCRVLAWRLAREMTDVTERVTVHCRMAKNPAPVCYLICLYFSYDFFNLLLNPFLPSTSLPTTTTTSFSYSFFSFILSLLSRPLSVQTRHVPLVTLRLSSYVYFRKFTPI